MSNSPIVRDVLDNGLRILTERMTQVRSVSIGVWLTRGSRHETAERGGIAHFVEHMLFKGTGDAVGRGHRPGDRLDRRPARRLHRQGIRQLLHQGARRAPAAGHRHPRPTSSCNPAFSADDIEREKKVVLEEIKMVEDTPDDLVHELFTQGFWENHPLGRPILGTQGDGRVVQRRAAARLLHATPTRAQNLIVSAVGNLEHDARARAGRGEVRRRCRRPGEPVGEEAPHGRAEDPDPQQGARAEPPVPRRRAAIRRITTIAIRATC